MRGAEITAPRDAPALNMPAANARSLTGNHSADAFTPPGQLPASLSPSIPRKNEKLATPRATLNRAHESDQTVMERTNPSLVPTQSKSFPDSACPIAYAIMNAETIVAYCSLVMSISFEISGHMMASEVLSM